MATNALDVHCPCCQAELKVDRTTGAVLTQKQPHRPPPIEDLPAAVAALKKEGVRREEIFQKSFAEEKAKKSILDQRFDELLKQAKENPDKGPQKRDIDLD